MSWTQQKTGMKSTWK